MSKNKGQGPTSSAFHADAVKHISAAALKLALSDASALLPALNSLVSGGTGYLADADINSLRNVQSDLQAQVTVAAKLWADPPDQKLHLESYRLTHAVIRNLCGPPFLITLKSGNHWPRNTTDRN